MNQTSNRPPIQQIRWTDRTAIVDVAGDIDLSHSVDFQQQLLTLLDQKPQRIVVNLAQVPYMDSSGVASLVKVLSRARKINATLFLVGLTARVKSLFEITRLDSVFSIKGTEQEAMA